MGGASASRLLGHTLSYQEENEKTMDYCYRLDLVPYTVTVQGLTAVTASLMSA